MPLPGNVNFSFSVYIHFKKSPNSKTKFFGTKCRVVLVSVNIIIQVFPRRKNFGSLKPAPLLTSFPKVLLY